MKTYTFGEILDKLSPGQEAESTDGKYHIFCDHDWDIRYVGSDRIIDICRGFRNANWYIIPKEITVLEAIKMMGEGKAPIHEYMGEKRAFGIDVTKAWETMELWRLQKGRWYAPDDI